jgi:hypothetical protein
VVNSCCQNCPQNRPPGSLHRNEIALLDVPHLAADAGKVSAPKSGAKFVFKPAGGHAPEKVSMLQHFISAGVFWGQA